MKQNKPPLKLTKICLAGLICLFYISFLPAANGFDYQDQAALLLSRIDLDAPGLGKVESLKDKPAEGIVALLDYYKQRAIVKHPIDRKGKPGSLNHSISKNDLEIADNA